MTAQGLVSLAPIQAMRTELLAPGIWGSEPENGRYLFQRGKKKSPRGHKIRMPTETCQTNDGGTNTASSVTSLPIWPQNLVIP